ncbi:DUF4382 domain-containing protein [Candidatus Micrarchaeota archaeon]|nr:DUF4382 domain-containing protein [Candidatus Micrarchaeota archaeon]
MNKTVFLIVFGILLLGCTSQQVQYPTPQATEQVPPGLIQEPVSGQGTLVIAAADKAVDVNSISQFIITIDKTEVRSKTGTWTTISTNPVNIELISLKNDETNAFLGEAKIPAGVYEEIRLSISQIQLIDSESNTHEVKLPSNELKLKGTTIVDPDSTSTARIDFLLDESLHQTGNGEYLMTPVVQLETRSNAEAKSEGNVVSINGGIIRTNQKIGMNLKGETKEGVQVLVGSEVVVNDNGVFVIEGVEILG